MSRFVQKGFRKTMLSDAVDPHHALVERFGEGYLEYRRLWEKTACGGIELPFPIHLDIELNPSCNLKCRMCVMSAETNAKASKDFWMSFENFKALIDEGIANGLKSIQLNNINEPLIRDDIPDFVAYASRAGVLDIMISTNGTLLSESMAKRLVGAGLTKLSVSIDAYNRETYNKIRIGGNFDKVVANVITFSRVRSSFNQPIPLLKVTFVKSPLNESELDRFVGFWRDKVELIAIQNINNPFDGDLWERTRDYFALQPKAIGLTDRICPHPFQRMAIQADGTALLCCNLRGPDLPIGDVFKNGLQQVYNGDPAKTYRQLHAQGRYHEIEVCRKCIMYSNLANP